MSLSSNLLNLQSVGAAQDRPRPRLDDLPLELLEQIMLFLPPSSVLHLMVNRTLRPICELHLYRNVWLVRKPHRSLHLLKTFVLRPDLALLVRDLRINLEWCDPLAPTRTLPDILQPNGLAALALARNVRSLTVDGLRWLSDPALSHVRATVSMMNLTCLIISDHSYRSQGNTARHHQDSEAMSNLRAVLQAQPHLETLSLFSVYLSTDVPNSIQASDVPDLVRFRGDSRYTETFLNAASQMEHLDLFFDYELTADFVMQDRWDGSRIRTLGISSRWGSSHKLDNLGSILARFPNIEMLYIKSNDFLLPHPPSFYCDNIASQLPPGSSLRKLEIHCYRTLSTTPLDLGIDAMLKFKNRCPNLEIIVDPGDRKWVYIRSTENESGFLPKQVSQYVGKPLLHGFDLPSPKWDV